VRPLNLGETLDASIKIVRARWRVLAMVMVVVALPIQLLDMLIIQSTTDVYEVGSSFASTSATSATRYSDEGAYLAGQVVIELLGLLGYLIGTVACYRAIADSYLGRDTTAEESLRFAARHAGRTLLLTILFVILLIPAFVALVLPGIWLTVAWSAAIPALLVEGLGGPAALKRSFGLVKDRWWATCGRLVVAYILVSVVTGVVTLLPLALTSSVIDDTSFGALLIEHAAKFVVSLMTTPFIAAVTTLVYFDLRVRKEGFDLALLAERMGGAPAEGPVPERGNAPAPAAPLWSGGGSSKHGRDAFGHPVASVPPPSSSPPSRPPATAPPGGRWAPPVAPEPQRPPDRDE
jgi:hypothetical protein